MLTTAVLMVSALLPLAPALPQPAGSLFEEEHHTLSKSVPQYNCQSSNKTSGPTEGLCHYCYTSWKEVVLLDQPKGADVNPTKKVIIEEQGCFNYDGPSEDAEECLNTRCLNIVTDGQSFEEGHRFCCCVGHFCNTNFSSDPIGKPPRPYDSSEDTPFCYTWLYVAAGAAALVLYAVVLTKVMSTFKLVRFGPFKFDTAGHPHTNNRHKSVPADMEIGPLDNDVDQRRPIIRCQNVVELGPDLDFSDFVLSERLCLGTGEFGSTLHRLSACSSGRGSSRGAAATACLSAKVFGRGQKRAFFNERDVYEAVGAAAKAGNPRVQLAFLQYFGTRENVQLHDGSTHDFMIGLEHNSQGFLANFLASNTVAWTDLCRILTSVSSGLSYLHSGFGSAHNTSFCHRDLNSQNVLVRSDLSCCLCNFEKSTAVSGTAAAAASSTAEPVGTPRYLAPEALNKHTLDASLTCSPKQVDVYALGLLFWEISRRCRDLYQGVPVPPFQLAYDHELGAAEPSLDQMRVVVSVQKARPLFPEVWKNSNPAIQRLRETMEDAWDADGEARVTSTCVLERARELTSLWERYHTQHALRSAPACNNSVIPRAIPSQQLQFQNNQLDIRRSLEDAGPSRANMPVKNDNILSQQQPFVQLQPHQGRNPCLERNNRVGEEDSEVAALVHKSFKDSQAAAANRFNVNLADTMTSDIEVEEEEAAPSDALRSIAQPISYLKNDFSQDEDEGLLSVRRLRFHRRQKRPPPVVKQPKASNVNREREQQQLLEARATTSCNNNETG